mmetsp:Transcript_48100/g.150926  ORF Transcript_48100/g.150926 Transcript_48100/m.150926 type:complete len:153 (-) Transcript_48100:16-474(-)
MGWRGEDQRAGSFQRSDKMSRSAFQPGEKMLCQHLLLLPSSLQRSGSCLQTNHRRMGPANTQSLRDSFTEYKAEIPNDIKVEAGPDRQLVLGFYSEENTEMRSASVELGQIPSLVANPPIPRSLYLNGKFASGTWRAYECTLATRMKFTLLE